MIIVIDNQQYSPIGRFLRKRDRKNVRSTLPAPDCYVAQITGGKWVIVRDGGVPVWRANREDILSHPAVIAALRANSESAKVPVMGVVDRGYVASASADFENRYRCDSAREATPAVCCYRVLHALDAATPLG